METRKSKLEAEKVELDIKISKLDSFLTTSIYKDLTIDHQTLLSIQLPIMKAYSQVLLERIIRF